MFWHKNYQASEQMERGFKTFKFLQPFCSHVRKYYVVFLLIAFIKAK